jgi:hypothetical protein
MGSPFSGCVKSETGKKKPSAKIDGVDHVPYAVQRGSKTGSKAAVFGSHCPKM